eukprot:363767-Chlamydomonas_euryale.AAC.8
MVTFPVNVSLTLTVWCLGRGAPVFAGAHSRHRRYWGMSLKGTYPGRGHVLEGGMSWKGAYPGRGHVLEFHTSRLAHVSRPRQRPSPSKPRLL